MLVHTSTFRVHVFDVDACGALRTNVLLRFLQQAASDASAAVGFDVEWYTRAGTLWVVRRTIAEYLTPAAYRDTVAVRTWVSDLRRVRSQREYEVVRAADGALIARASTDWVYVDVARGGPAQPPEEMRQRLMPDAVAQPRPPRTAAPPPSHAARLTRRVELAEIDSVGHVNNAHYAVYVEQAVLDALAAHGWRIDPLAGDALPRVTRHDLEYFAEAAYDDALTASVWVSDSDANAFTTECTLSRNDRRILHASTRWQCAASVVLPARLHALRGLDPPAP